MHLKEKDNSLGLRDRMKNWWDKIIYDLLQIIGKI